MHPAASSRSARSTPVTSEQLRLVRSGGVCHLLDLGAEDLIPAHAPFIIVSQWATAPSCISLHLEQAKRATSLPRSAATRYRTNIACPAH
jgi:hypothetical protein